VVDSVRIERYDPRYKRVFKSMVRFIEDNGFINVSKKDGVWMKDMNMK
jgi:hypothetical protein